MVQVTHPFIPLCDRNMINARLVTVSEIAEFMSSYKVSQDFNFAEGDPEGNIVRPKIHHVLSSVLTTLGRLPDVQLGIKRKYSFEHLQHLR